ncbi:Hypothetical protein A7982_10745 [Minicystis rosea]|nr:Hypothetical protein A7982_10745 [Minicystis rosea]
MWSGNRSTVEGFLVGFRALRRACDAPVTPSDPDGSLVVAPSPVRRGKGRSTSMCFRPAAGLDTMRSGST